MFQVASTLFNYCLQIIIITTIQLLELKTIHLKWLKRLTLAANARTVHAWRAYSIKCDYCKKALYCYCMNHHDCPNGSSTSSTSAVAIAWIADVQPEGIFNT